MTRLAQVVAGIKFVLTVMLRSSDCGKTADAAQLTPWLCPMPENGTVMTQTVTIVWQPWLAPGCSLTSIGAAQPVAAPTTGAMPSLPPQAVPTMGPMPGARCVVVKGWLLHGIGFLCVAVVRRWWQW